MLFINYVIIAGTIVLIVVAFILLLCLCESYMTPNRASHVIFTYDMILNEVYNVVDSIFNIVCCSRINRTVIPRDEPICEIELTEIVLVSNPHGEIELGSPSKIEN